MLFLVARAVANFRLNRAKESKAGKKRSGEFSSTNKILRDGEKPSSRIANEALSQLSYTPIIEIIQHFFARPGKAINPPKAPIRF